VTPAATGNPRSRILVTAELTADGVARLGKLAEVSYQPRTVTKRMLAGAKLVEVLAGYPISGSSAPAAATP